MCVISGAVVVGPERPGGFSTRSMQALTGKLFQGKTLLEIHWQPSASTAAHHRPPQQWLEKGFTVSSLREENITVTVRSAHYT